MALNLLVVNGNCPGGSVWGFKDRWEWKVKIALIQFIAYIKRVRAKGISFFPEYSSSTSSNCSVNLFFKNCKWSANILLNHIVDPAFRLNAFPTRMASSIFILIKNWFYLFKNDLESPLIFVLFLKGKQNKKEKP